MDGALKFVQTCATIPQGTRQALGRAWQLDPDKPWFHVMPRNGWLNDPNGPIFYKGRYHIFYQHMVGSSEWRWELSWGHASSADLVHWRHEPLAIVPTPQGYDAAGCWSGCTAVDEQGVPVMLYTGVRLRNSPGCGTLPPHAAHDLGLDIIECQCAAVCDPACPDLRVWKKLDAPVIPSPPRSDLVGFRDPYVFARGGAGRPWKLLLGSGVAGRGGTLLVYHAASLTSGWEYMGELTEGRSAPCADWDLGDMWECPFLVPLPAPPVTGNGYAGASTSAGAARAAATPAADHAHGGTMAGGADAYANGPVGPGGEGGDGAAVHVLCVSPYPHTSVGRPTNPCLVWLGELTPGDKFLIEEAQGPERLDLGDVLYAPNAFTDAAGRVLMLAWLQELRGSASSCGFDYAGCLSLPRVLTLQGGRLHQAPAPELRQLRRGPGVHMRGMRLGAGAATPVPGVRGPSLDFEVTLRRGSARRAGVLLRAWLHKGPDGGPPAAAALVVDWQAGTLEMVYPTALDADSRCFDWDAPHRRVGGTLAPPPGEGGALGLRILVDHSAVEVFTDGGQALATRVYRGRMPTGEDPGLFLVADGGDAWADVLAAYGMNSIWKAPEDRPAKAHEPAEA